MAEPKELSEKEIAKRRDETLRRMGKSPPKPHSEIAAKAKRKQTTVDSKKNKRANDNS